MLASTISSASLTMSCSLGPYKGERGRAIRPVRADSRIPKGAISFMKESIREGFAELLALLVVSCVKKWTKRTYSSTMQLLVLISKTFPLN